MEFPVSINKIEISLRNNNPDIAVNVLSQEEGKEQLDICRKSMNNDRSKTVSLLLIVDADKKHYTVIKSLSRLLRSENTKHEESQEFCISCLQGFSSTEVRDKHFEYCIDNEAVKVEMPRQGSKIRFNDGSKQMKVPFVMYADFESILAKG